MKQASKELIEIAKTLQNLSQKLEKVTEDLENNMDKLNASPSTSSSHGAVKVTGGATVLDQVYAVIRRSRKGISITNLRKKTGLEPRQVSNALYKLTKKELVYAKSRGLYTKK